MVSFHKQKAITPEDIVRYGPLSNLKKTLRYKFHKLPIKNIRLRERTPLGVTYVRTDRRTNISTYGRTGAILNAPAIAGA